MYQTKKEREDILKETKEKVKGKIGTLWYVPNSCEREYYEDKVPLDPFIIARYWNGELYARQKARRQQMGLAIRQCLLFIRGVIKIVPITSKQIPLVAEYLGIGEDECKVLNKYQASEIIDALIHKRDYSENGHKKIKEYYTDICLTKR